MKTTDALVDIGSAVGGLVIGKVVDSKLQGLPGSLALIGAGAAAWYFGKDYGKVGGALLAGYGLATAIKSQVLPMIGQNSATQTIASLLPGPNPSWDEKKGKNKGTAGLAFPYDQKYDQYGNLMTGSSYVNGVGNLIGLGEASVLANQLAGSMGNAMPDLANSLVG